MKKSALTAVLLKIRTLSVILCIAGNTVQWMSNKLCTTAVSGWPLTGDMKPAVPEGANNCEMDAKNLALPLALIRKKEELRSNMETLAITRLTPLLCGGDEKERQALDLFRSCRVLSISLFVLTKVSRTAKNRHLRELVVADQRCAQIHFLLKIAPPCTTERRWG